MLDLVRIAESYFERLLHQTPVSQAVPALSAEWSRRSSLYGDTALTEPERTINTVNTYFFLARIGGHGLFFKHTALGQAHHTISCLQTCELATCADLLSRALALCSPYPDAPEPPSLLRRAQFVSDDPRAAALDRQLWQQPADEQILAFMRAHSSLLLLPERGLA